MDQDFSGEIDFQEFETIWHQTNGLSNWDFIDSQADRLILDAVELHTKYDTDESGSIDDAEFESLYSELVSRGYQIGTLASALKTIDANGDKEITLRELVMFITTAVVGDNKEKAKKALA